LLIIPWSIAFLIATKFEPEPEISTTIFFTIVDD
jgi:hypothetical protein